MFLQETHSCDNINWKKDWPGKMFMAHGTSNSRGCMILFNEKLEIEIKSVKEDDNGRFLIVQCEIMGEEFVLTNVYAPNIETEQVRFLTNIENVLLNLGFTSSARHVIGGDWNMIRDSFLDKSGGIVNIKQRSVERQDEIINRLELNDIWRIKNPNTNQYTWRQKTLLIQCRLDYWLISDSVFDLVSNVDIVPSVQSDHSAITLNIKLMQESRKGPSLWKFNSSLLDDKEYTLLMKKQIKQWKLMHNMTDSRIQWEIIKYEIRRFTISYAKQKKGNSMTEKRNCI